jgi:hypothetical protein
MHEQKNNYSASKQQPKPLSLQNLNNQTGVEFLLQTSNASILKCSLLTLDILTTVSLTLSTGKLKSVAAKIWLIKCIPC